LATGWLAMDTLSSWLGAIGLEQYASLLESHGIDLRSLPLLSDSDLAELGVLLGHRRLLLKSIATLDSGHGEPVDALGTRDAERRQLTVLFCDLVGSTALAQRIDPEALRDLMRAYQQTCREAIGRYDGHVAQYRGDGLEVYFGWPHAHEDDAERAVRAALEIVRDVGQLASPEPVRVRIGIATGLVVVGADGAGDASVPSAAVGETPNLAARLQELAGPNQIVVAPATRRLLGQSFDVEDLGDHDLKGIDSPVRAQRIRGAARSESRFDATRGGRYTPFVGREHEVALLLARWQQAGEGEGQVVLLVGEPGIGKSRIPRVLHERLAAEPHLRLQYQCSPYHTGSAFFPIIEQIERAAGLDRDDTPERKLDKLEAMLDLTPEALPVVAPLFGALLSLPIDRYPTRMLSIQKHRELTIGALVDHLVNLAQRQPVLIICEDAHWIDPSTLETMALLVERIRHTAILLVITCRPEFVPPWTAHGNVTLLNLNRLSKRYGAAMAVGLAGGKTLPAEVLTQILERTDGVPLFVEELTRTVLELGLLKDQGDRWELSGPLPALAIPSTLQDSLTARLDHLGSVKDLAQVGACIGREFDHAMLAAVAPMSGGELQDALDKLVASGLIFRHSSATESIYSFKHALVQDVAYDGLLKSRRQQIHERIARSLAHDFKDRANAQPELLALHLTRAGLIEQAVPQWRTATRSAIANNRHREALGYVDAGLALVDRAAVEQKTNLEVGLLVAGAACHWVITGYACKPAANLLARAEMLLDGVTDQRLLVLALSAILMSAYVRADTTKALATAERLVALGEATSDMDQRIITFASASSVLTFHGQFERCRRLLEFVVENYKTDRRFAYGRINDAKVHAYVWLSWIHVMTGRLDQARHCARMAIEHATTNAEPFILSQALSVGALPFAEAGDCEEALRLCQRCIELCDAQNLPFWQGWAMVHEGIALMRLGQHDSAETRLAQAIEHLVVRGTRNNLGYVYARRIHALALLGRFDEARRNYDIGRVECVETGQLLALSGLNYARGVTEVLDPDSDVAAAEHWLHIALADARSSGMRLVELRAAIALAGLWQLQDKHQTAHDLLEPILDSFTEGLDCLDLRRARDLVDELAGGRSRTLPIVESDRSRANLMTAFCDR
jgi:class 3 adenylate cyclase/tetratricopeptide (TPR) repeat protein